MLEPETFARVIQLFGIAFIVVEFGLFFGLLGLMQKMFDHGDHAWGWVTLVVALVRIGDHWIGKVIPGAGVVLGFGSLIGILIVLTVGWIRHRKYEATWRMIVLTVLILANFALAVGLAQFMVMSLPTGPPSDS